jgi:hypothetical protein
MNETSRRLNDKDLLFLVKTLMPDCSDISRMIRVLRDDREILEGMLADDRLVRLLIDSPDTIIRVSPTLFFIVILNRVKQDLQHRNFTVESMERHRAMVFDTSEICEFIGQVDIRDYLADMLASFVKITSYSIPVRVRKGLWRKYRFSDFDINSLIEYSQMIDEGERYRPYKRIADICLFTLGVFPDFLISSAKSYRERLRTITQRSKQDIMHYGRYFYKIAARHRVAQIQETDKTLQALSDNFVLASKPLTLMAGHYLGNLKEELFLE